MVVAWGNDCLRGDRRISVLSRTPTFHRTDAPIMGRTQPIRSAVVHIHILGAQQAPQPRDEKSESKEEVIEWQMLV